METLFSPVLLAIAFGLIYGALPLLVHALYDTHKRVVTCPRTGGLGEIGVAVTSRAPNGQPVERVSSCSLWSKVKGCNEQCVKH